MLSRIWFGLWRLLSLLLGTWQPPPWLRAIGRGLGRLFAPLGRFAERRPGAFRAAILTLIGLAVAGDFGYRAWQRRPKPEMAEATAGELSAQGLYEGSEPVPLSITFDERGQRASVAKLALVGKVVAKGIEVSPPLAGTWKWVSDSELQLKPQADWPVGTTLKVHFDKDIFASNVKLASSDLKVKTPEFTARIGQTEFYQDPRDPKVKRITANLSFSHPVDVTDLPSHIQMHYQAGGGGLFAHGKDLKTTVRYDKWKGEAYVQSEVVPIPDDDTDVIIELGRGVRAARGGPGTDKLELSKVTLPGLSTFFHITDVASGTADDDKGEIQQVLTVQATTEVAESAMRGAVTAVLLPKGRPPDADYPAGETYTNWGEGVPEAVASAAKQVELVAIPTEQENSKVFHYRYRAPADRWLLVRVKAGIQSFGGYPLVHAYSHTVEVPEFPPMLHIQGSGSVLSLAGEKKVSLLARQLDAIHVDLMRVLPGEVNHLVTQTEGAFASPNFANYKFDKHDIAEQFDETLPLVQPAPGKNQYASFDFSKYVGGASPRRGLFFLRVSGWDPVNEHDNGPSDERFVLVTDLGLLVKKNADGSREVFVQRLSQGLPAAGVAVQVLGRNGISVAEATTDAEGRAHFPDLGKLKNEKAPVVYLATLGDDLSFLPVERSDRLLSFSRFDIDGVREDARPGTLHAYVFSDRGLYRPGDAVHIGAIVKQPDWDKSLAGVPLEWTVTDPRSTTLVEKRISLSAAAFEELSFSTTDTSPTGEYTASLYTIRGGQVSDLVGQVSVRVEEFLPDRLRISSHFSDPRLDGWVHPDGLSAEVDLQNLFGTPAEDRRVTGTLTLSPQPPAFRRYPDYTFFDPAEAKRSYSTDLSEQHTDKDGKATFALDLSQYEKATYRLTFKADGFEAEGGRAVSTESSVLVSPFDYLVGTKADGELGYVSKGAARNVQILAVDQKLDPKAVSGLRAVLVEEKYVSVLTEQSSGLFRYVSTRKEVTLGEKPLGLEAKPSTFALDTSKPGNFVLSIRDVANTELARVAYSVAGKANLSRSLDRNAELEVKLDKKDYGPSDTIQVSINAPYTGAGLITIERDRVYAAHWFKTDTTSSVQTVVVPKDLEGNGYVNVTFVRALDSPEVFMSPLSAGVVPFSVSKATRTVEVKLDVPSLVKPGQELKVDYSVNTPGRIVIFGVDEGILQVAHYKTPDPLAYFFRKRALQVDTSQILDLLLPEFSVLAKASKAGGDEGGGALGKNLNPFKRKRDKPVVFWSGIVDAKGSGSYRYLVPDSFNGELRVMAVAVSPGRVGATVKPVTVRGPFVLSPNVPTFVAPGDEFQVSVGVSNNVDGSGAQAAVAVKLEVEAGLEILDGAERKLTIGEGRESSTTFKLRGTKKLGSAGLTFHAEGGGQRAKLRTDLSVRPASPYIVISHVGVLQGGKAELQRLRKLYAEDRKLEADASRLPLGLAGGLAQYLNAYPYGCTEQIVSQAFPALVLQDRPEFGYSAEAVSSSLERAYQVLAERQNGDGAFGMWAANSTVSNFQNAYAAHFLTEAKEREQGAPREVLQRSLNYLSSLAGDSFNTLSEGREHAYALYVLARNGKGVGGAAAALQKRLDAVAKDAWRSDLAAVYLAGTYKILHQDALAEGLARGLSLGQSVGAYVDYNHYYDQLARDGQLLFILARHFPEKLKGIPGADLESMAQALNGGYNSLSAASAMLGFDALARAMLGDVGANNAAPTVFELLAAGPKPLPMKGLFGEAPVSDEATGVRFADSSGLALFYGFTEGGFDSLPPTKVFTEGLEVEREYQLGGKAVTAAKLGQVVEVHLKVRGLGKQYVPNVAFVDLLPAGFEVVVEHPKPAENAEGEGGDAEPSGHGGADDDQTEPPGGDDGDGEGGGDGAAAGMVSFIAKGGDFAADFADVREDRVLLFGSVEPAVHEFVYAIRATNQGKMQVPPILAESMYDHSIWGRSLGGTFEITAP